MTLGRTQALDQAMQKSIEITSTLFAVATPVEALYFSITLDAF
jgi:hypothetical protein